MARNIPTLKIVSLYIKSQKLPPACFKLVENHLRTVETLYEFPLFFRVELCCYNNKFYDNKSINNLSLGDFYGEGLLPDLQLTA